MRRKARMAELPLLHCSMIAMKFDLKTGNQIRV